MLWVPIRIKVFMEKYPHLLRWQAIEAIHKVFCNWKESLHQFICSIFLFLQIVVPHFTYVVWTLFTQRWSQYKEISHIWRLKNLKDLKSGRKSTLMTICIVFCQYWEKSIRSPWKSVKMLKGKATLKGNIIKMKDILFPKNLVQVSYKSVEK